MSSTPEDNGSEPDPTPEKKARRRGRGGLIVLIAFMVFFAGIAATAFAMIGRPITAPDWVRDRVERLLSDQIANADIAFGRILIGVNDNLEPYLRLEDMLVRDDAARPMVALADADIQIAARPLLSRQLRVTNVTLTGGRLTLRRFADGQFAFAFGEGDAPLGEAGGLLQTLESVEQIFLTDAAANLERVQLDGLTLSYEDALSGQFWVVDGGRAELERDGAELRLRADLALLTGREYASTVELSYDTRLDSVASDISVNINTLPAQDIATQVPALTWLSALEAPISGAMRLSLDEDGLTGPLFGTLDFGAGALQPTEATRPVKFDSAQTYFTFDPVENTLSFDTVSVRSEMVNVTGTGRAYMREFRNGLPQTLLGQFQLTDLQANPDNFFDAPLSFSQSAIDFRLKLDPFSIEVGQFMLQAEGTRLTGDARVTADPDGWSVALNAFGDEITPQAVTSIWPSTQVERTRAWVAQNVQEGRLHNVQAVLRATAGKRPHFRVGWEFEDATVKFMKTLPPITGGVGRALLADNRFLVSVDQGQVQAPRGGAIQIAGSRFEVANTSQKPAQAEIQLKTDATITATLSLLDEEPFGFLTKANLPVDLADGRARATIDLALPLKKDLQVSQVSYAATGTASNLRSTQLVKDRTLAAPLLGISVTSKAVVIDGEARLGEVPLSGTFRLPLGADAAAPTVTATVELSQQFLDEFRVDLPPGSLSGRASGDLALSLPKGAPPTFRLTSDLRGASLRFAALDWAKPAAARGELAINGRLGTPIEIDTLSLSAPGLNASGRIALNEAGAFQRASFDRVRVGDWLNAPVTLIGRGPGAAPAVQITAGTLDLRRAKLGQGTGQGGPIDLALDELVVSDGISLTNLRGQFDAAGGFNGNFRANVNDGSTPIFGTVIPDRNGTAVRITAEDAGRVMGNARLIRSARGGDLNLVLRPRAADGQYDGTLTITETRVQNAPALANLLSAVSVVGLLDQMTNQGVLFTNVDAKFVLTPNVIAVTESSATGPSLGISMDGTYRPATSQMDMQGVFSPLYLLNGIGSFLTRRGEGLIGFNFTLSGDPSAPQVAVNPLSALTPGMFREIFRRPAPRVSQ
ncbi:MAG: DUF3971 domain-containing protein [Pseudomonadota bacterium]